MIIIHSKPLSGGIVDCKICLLKTAKTPNKNVSAVKYFDALLSIRSDRLSSSANAELTGGFS